MQFYRISFVYPYNQSGRWQDIIDTQKNSTNSQKTQCLLCYINVVGFKGKAVPLQAWNGPEGSSKLRFSDFMTTAQDCGKVVSLKHRPPLPTRNTPGTHSC